MVSKDLFSSRSEEWGTPQSLFDKLNVEFRFTLDPCANHRNAKCVRYFTKGYDGLGQSLTGERVFMNPPYGKEISFWMKKIATSNVKVGVALVHSRTDTKWWHSYVEPYADEIRFIKGRIPFIGINKDGAYVNWHLWGKQPPEGSVQVKNSGQHDSMIVIFKSKP